jgi:hypothetical protein
VREKTVHFGRLLGAGLLLAPALITDCGGKSASHEYDGASGRAGAAGSSGASESPIERAGTSGQAASEDAGRAGSSIGTAGEGGEGGRAEASGGAGAAEGGASGAASDDGGAGSNDGGASGHGEAGASSEETSVAKLTALARAYCTGGAVNCCRQSSAPGNIDYCIGKTTAKMPLASIMSGAVVINGAKVAECLAALEAAGSDCSGMPAHACDHLYAATRKLGESCVEAYECAPSGLGAMCFTDSTGKSVCTALSRGNEGDPCLASCRGDSLCRFAASGNDETPNTVCLESRGLYCRPRSGVCESIIPAEDECEDPAACGLDADCYEDLGAGFPRPVDICFVHDSKSCEVSLNNCEGDLACIASECAAPTKFEDWPDCSGPDFFGSLPF